MFDAFADDILAVIVERIVVRANVETVVGALNTPVVDGPATEHGTLVRTYIGTNQKLVTPLPENKFGVHKINLLWFTNVVTAETQGVPAFGEARGCGEHNGGYSR